MTNVPPPWRRPLNIAAHNLRWPQPIAVDMATPPSCLRPYMESDQPRDRILSIIHEFSVTHAASRVLLCVMFPYVEHRALYHWCARKRSATTVYARHNYAATDRYYLSMLILRFLAQYANNVSVVMVMARVVSCHFDKLLRRFRRVCLLGLLIFYFQEHQ